MHCREQTASIERRHKYLICKSCHIPISSFSGVVTMATIIAHRNNQHSPLLYCLLVLRRDSLIHCTTEKEYNGVFLFEKEVENSLFERRVKTADNNRVCFAYRFCPSNTAVFGFGRNRTRGKEGNKMAFPQIGISKRVHKKAQATEFTYPALRSWPPVFRISNTDSPRQMYTNTYCAKTQHCV